MRVLPFFASIAFALHAGAAMADCTAVTSISLDVVSPDGMGTRFEYNPFDSQSSDVTLEIELNGACTNPASLQFEYFNAGSTDPGFPLFRFEDGGVTVYESNSDYLNANLAARPVINNVVAATAQSGQVALDAIPTAQAPGATALSPLTTSLDLGVRLTLDGGVVVAETLSLPVETVQRNTVALTDDFIGGDRTQDVDFGEIDVAGESIAKNLWLWSNTDFVISASSFNGGIMVRDGGAMGDSTINSIPYSLTLANASGGTLLTLDDTATANTAVESVRLTSTIVDGNQYDVDITIPAGAASGRRAGTYEDEVTLSIAPRL